jgi:peptide/nickel transport system substrate-binding protein
MIILNKIAILRRKSAMRYQPRWLLPLLLLSLVLAACAPIAQAPAAAPATGAKQLIISETFWPDAGYAIETDDAFALSAWGATETLLKVDFDGQIKPLLAESWERVDDLRWSFKLREGVTFHNGEALTAEAVVTALNYLLAAETPPRGLSPENVASIEASDERTVVITTVEPDALTPNRLTGPSFAILAPAAYASTPPAVFGTGTGPFVLAEEVPEQSVTLRKNEAYWGEAPKLDEVVVLAAPDGEVRATMLRTGEVHIAEHLPIPQLPLLEAEADINVVRTPQPRTTTLYLNNRQGPLADLLVRRAVLHAIDKRALVAAVLEGVGAPAAGPFAPNEVWVNPDLPVDTFDPEAAKALLAEAGIGEGALTLNIWTYPARSNLPPTAVAIQQMLTDVGIGAEVRIAPYNVLEPTVREGNYDIFIVSRGHLLDNYDPEGFLQADIGCDGSFNLSGYCNEAIDAKLAEARTLIDAEARYAIYREIQQTIFDDVACIWLDYTEQLYGVRAGVLNYQPHPLEYYLVTPALDLAR